MNDTKPLTHYTLPNGEVFCKEYKGMPLRIDTDTGEILERKPSTFAELEIIEVGDITWIKFHNNYLSTCGWFKVAQYEHKSKWTRFGWDTTRVDPYFQAYKPTTWKENMQSTFGNTLDGVHNYPTFEEIAKAINEWTKTHRKKFSEIKSGDKFYFWSKPFSYFKASDNGYKEFHTQKEPTEINPDTLVYIQ